MSSDQSENVRPPPPRPHKPKKMFGGGGGGPPPEVLSRRLGSGQAGRRSGRSRGTGFSSSDDEIRSTPECTSCDGEDAEMESESVSEKGKVAMTTLFVLFRVLEAFSQVIYKPYQAVALNQVYSIKVEPRLYIFFANTLNERIFISETASPENSWPTEHGL